MGMFIGLLILAAVVGTGVWLTMRFKPTGEDVLDAEPVPKPFRKTRAGTGLALFKPERIESESPIDSAVVKLPEHKIVRTWITMGMAYPHYNWVCSCGVASYGINMEQGKRDASLHCREHNRAEDLKAKTNGRFSW